MAAPVSEGFHVITTPRRMVCTCEGHNDGYIRVLPGVSVPTVQKHVERGMASLRRALRVTTIEGHR